MAGRPHRPLLAEPSWDRCDTCTRRHCVDSELNNKLCAFKNSSKKKLHQVVIPVDLDLLPAGPSSADPLIYFRTIPERSLSMMRATILEVNLRWAHIDQANSNRMGMATGVYGITN